MTLLIEDFLTMTAANVDVILDAYIARSEEADTTRNRQLSMLKARAIELKGKIGRLLSLVANGTMEADDPQLKDVLADLKAQGHAVAHEISILSQSMPAGGSIITDDKIAKLSDLLRGALTDENPGFRKAYVRLFVEGIIVDDTEIRMSGPKNALAATALKSELPNATNAAPSFVRNWRTRKDSNLQPPDS